MISPEKKKRKEKENKNNKQTNKHKKTRKGLRKEGYHHFFAAVTHFLRVLH